MVDSNFEQLGEQIQRALSLLAEQATSITSNSRKLDGDPDVGPGVRTRLEKVETRVGTLEEQFVSYQNKQAQAAELQATRTKWLLIGLGANLAFGEVGSHLLSLLQAIMQAVGGT